MAEWTSFSWRGFGDGFGDWESRCRICVIPGRRWTVVLDDTGNRGTSVTNCIEYIAPLIAEQFGFAVEEADWFEFVPKDNRFDRISLVARKDVPGLKETYHVSWCVSTQEEDVKLRTLCSVPAGFRYSPRTNGLRASCWSFSERA